MALVELRVFSDTSLNKPSLYCRYVDDIFVFCEDIAHLDRLRTRFEECSVLHFTYELTDINRQLPFLDTLVTQLDDKLHLSVYKKPSSSNETLNGAGYCPESYRRNVILGYLHRAYLITQDWADFQVEVERIRVRLIDNNYSNSEINQLITFFINSKTNLRNQTSTTDKKLEVLQIYYRAQIHNGYKIDETIIRSIIKKNVQIASPSTHKLSFNIYYKPVRAHQLVMKNNFAKTNLLKRTNIVYQFRCPLHNDSSPCYIGQTRTTLARRLTMHVQGGNINTHFQQIHNTRVTRQILDDNVTILSSSNDPVRLRVCEALLIQELRPDLNTQDGRFDRTLGVFNIDTDSLSTTSARVNGLPKVSSVSYGTVLSNVGGIYSCGHGVSGPSSTNVNGRVLSSEFIRPPDVASTASAEFIPSGRPPSSRVLEDLPTLGRHLIDCKNITIRRRK